MHRTRVIASVVLTVLVAYCGIAVALIQSASLASVVASAIILSGLGLTIGLLLEIHPALARDQAVEVILGQGDLMRRYEDLRRTEGAVGSRRSGALAIRAQNLPPTLPPRGPTSSACRT